MLLYIHCPFPFNVRLRELLTSLFDSYVVCHTDYIFLLQYEVYIDIDN